MSPRGLTTESSLFFVFLDTVVKPRYDIRLLPKTINIFLLIIYQILYRLLSCSFDNAYH
ncbi:MAG: palindromic element RPE4 domain-containing protein [Rickettsia aeschlimannii]